jgi:hypothetical protein
MFGRHSDVGKEGRKEGKKEGRGKCTWGVVLAVLSPPQWKLPEKGKKQKKK